MTQLNTTMDVDCYRWMDWFHGGLQFQVRLACARTCEGSLEAMSATLTCSWRAAVYPCSVCIRVASCDV